VDKIDSDGNTPLHIASIKNYIEPCVDNNRFIAEEIASNE
jgi:ankyrin repeat protein